jgi:hypothetical protein
MSLDFQKRDEFKRQPLAEKLIQLLVSDVIISPMIIDGPWGSGKTEFTLKLIKLFSEQHPSFNLIYIDAFKADHSDNPLMTVLAAVIRSLPEQEQQDFIKKAAPALKSLTKNIAKGAVGWILRQDATDVLDDVESEVKKASNSLIDYSVEKLLKSHVEAEKDLQALQHALAEIAKEQPLVLFIDELDRCRPNFSVSMLETIKHVFNVENVQFVMITNHLQLMASVKNIYGEQLDAKRYLDKFIAFSFKLSGSVGQNSYDIKQASDIHFKNLIRKSPILSQSVLNDSRKSSLIEFGIDLIKSHGLSLREVETFIRYLEIYQTLAKGLDQGTIFGNALLRLVGVFIYSFDNRLSKELDRDIVNAYSVNEFFGKEKLIDIDQGMPQTLREIVHAMFALECNAHAGAFDNKLQESKAQWKEHFDAFFSGGYHDSDEGNIVLVKSAIRELMMISER